MKPPTNLARPAFVFAVMAACQSTPHDPAYYQARLDPEAEAGAVVAADGVQLAYTVRGQGEPALVFIHGWACDQSYWDAQVPAFAPSHQVVTLDLGGHGASGTQREVWDIPTLAGDVVALVESLDLSEVILVGHSMGGPVALEASRRLPRRVLGVVGVDTLHDATQEWDRAQGEIFIRQFETNFAGTCKAFVNAMFPEGADEELVARVSSGMCGADPGIAVPLMRSFMRYDLAASLGAATVPVRCVNSPMIETNIEGNQALGVDFDAVTIPEVGHFLMMERPAEFNRHLAAWVEELG